MNHKNQDVLEFYKILPFNVYGDISTAVNQIKKTDPFIIYPELKKIFSKFDKIKVIDFGCGGGWLVNSLSYHHADNIEIVGVDFNPSAIEYAKKIKSKLNLSSDFFVSDLFTYKNEKKFNLIISLGALHHTNNCKEAIKYICKFSETKSYLFLGLYHKYGRKPFLDHFEKIKNKSEEIKFNEYKKLHKIKDKKKLYSWFRDQVLHPHETQHTFEELVSIFNSAGYNIISTSINNFKKINDTNEIICNEKKLYYYAKEKLKIKEYFPGFFVTIGEKI